MLAQVPFELGVFDSVELHSCRYPGQGYCIMNLGEAPRRMHDPKSWLANHFEHEHTKFPYTHQDLPDDSIYRGAVDFSEVVGSITNPLEKSHIFQYQKDLNTSTLHFR